MFLAFDPAAVFVVDVASGDPQICRCMVWFVLHGGVLNHLRQHLKIGDYIQIHNFNFVGGGSRQM